MSEESEKRFKYKCRLCGNIFSISADDMPNPEAVLESFMRVPSALTLIHKACPYGLGIGDLEGLFFKKEK